MRGIQDVERLALVGDKSNMDRLANGVVHQPLFVVLVYPGTL
jgi:hypothetical protein